MAFTGNNPRFNSTILTDIGLASVSNPPSGAHKLINRGGTFQVKDSSGLETAIGAGGTVDRVTQTAHGFSVGEVLYFDGTDYARALANAANTSEIVGMVSRVIDVDTFELTLEGKVTGLSGLTAGDVYFLSPITSGLITATEPTVLGHISLPVGVAISATVFYVRSSRGAVVGSTNARTEIALANNTTTNVQSVAAYQAGELTGWVEIDGTTDLKFYVAAPFAKNGAATDFNISPQYVGDTPPVGFSLSVTSGGIIQATLPSIAGYVSAKINFALNAPAVGATFPLSIDSTLVQFSTLKAKDSGGFIFQENGGTQIGSINDSGGWTFSQSQASSTVSHNFYGRKGTIANQNYIIILNSDDLSTGSSTLRWGLDSSNGYAFQDSALNGVGGGGYRFAVNTLGVGGHDSEGAWFFGHSTLTTYHTFRSNTTTTNYPVMHAYHYDNTASSNGNPGLMVSKRYNDASGAQTFISFEINNSTTTPGTGSGSGRIAANGANQAQFQTYSDVRLKENIQDLNGELHKILSLRPVEFDYKSGGHQLGFIAQEIQEVYPDAVAENSQDGMLVLTGWDKTTARLVKAIQELSAKVTALESQLN